MDREIDYSFKILEEVLKLQKYNNKNEVLSVANRMLKIAQSKKNLSDHLKKAYQEAYAKLDSLTFKEINEIIEILKMYN